jgi:hypothetical protein
MAQNVTVMRRDTLRIINEDPWSVTVYRHGRTPDDEETSWSFTGRLTPAVSRGVLALNPVQMGGETGESRYGWVLLTEWDVPKIRGEDEIRATQVSSGYERSFTAFNGMQFAYKQEVIVDERQP